MMLTEAVMEGWQGAVARQRGQKKDFVAKGRR